MEHNELFISNFLETIPYFFSQNYKNVLSNLSENERSIMAEWYEKTNYISDEKEIIVEELKPGFVTEDFKKYFSNFPYNSDDYIISVNDNISEKYKITKYQLFDIQMHYMNEVFNFLENQFNDMKKEYNKNKEERFVTPEDFAFLDEDVIQEFLTNLDLIKMLSMIRCEKECVKAHLIKKFFENPKTDKKEAILDIIFTLPFGNTNLYAFEKIKWEIILELADSGKIKLPENIKFPTKEDVNKRLLKVREISNEKINEFEITDILYCDEITLLKILKNEDIEDENFYALLFAYRNTELYNAINNLLSEEFKNNISTNFKRFEGLPEEDIKNKVEVIKNQIKKMRDDNEIVLYSDRLWVLPDGQIAFLNNERHVEKFNFSLSFS